MCYPISWNKRLQKEIFNVGFVSEYILAPLCHMAMLFNFVSQKFYIERCKWLKLCAFKAPYLQKVNITQKTVPCPLTDSKLSHSLKVFLNECGPFACWHRHICTLFTGILGMHRHKVTMPLQVNHRTVYHTCVENQIVFQSTCASESHSFRKKLEYFAILHLLI